MRTLLILLAVITAVPCGADPPCGPADPFDVYVGGATGCQLFWDVDYELFGVVFVAQVCGAPFWDFDEVNVPHMPPPLLQYDPLVVDGQRVPRGFRFYTSMSPGPWSWDFGDGTTARTNVTSHDHVYAAAGVYVVRVVNEHNGERYSIRLEVQHRRRTVRH